MSPRPPRRAQASRDNVLKPHWLTTKVARTKAGGRRQRLHGKILIGARIDPGLFVEIKNCAAILELTQQDFFDTALRTLCGVVHAKRAKERRERELDCHRTPPVDGKGPQHPRG